MLLGALITALWMGIASDARAQEALTVLLDWFVNPDHGPLIVAQEKGYFAEAGLEVDLADGSGGSTPATPEPKSILLFGLALGASGLALRRRRRATA